MSFSNKRRIVCAASVAIVTALSGAAEVGVHGIPCIQPFVFKDAAVNVVVLQYETPPTLPGPTDVGVKLSMVMQKEVLRSIAKFGSVGAVQMDGTAAECDPDLVVAKLLGRKPGAKEVVGPGRGLIVVWGRFFTQGPNVFVQTFSRFLRVGTEEALDVNIQGRRFSAQVSTQAFAHPPRRVSLTDLDQFERQFMDSTILRTAPNDIASSVRLP